MTQYIVLRDCYGYLGRYWVKGEVLMHLPDNPLPPKEHFLLFTSETASEEEIEIVQEDIKKEKKRVGRPKK